MASVTVFADKAGRFVRAHGLDEVADLPEVLEVMPVAQPGQVLGGDHEVFGVNVLLAGSSTEAEVLDLNKEIAALVHLEIAAL